MNTHVRWCNLLSTFITALLLALPLAGHSQTSSLLVSPFGATGSGSGTGGSFSGSGTSGSSSIPLDTPSAPLTPLPPLSSDTFKIGMHAHGLCNGGDGSSPPARPMPFKVGLLRHWDISKLHDPEIWKDDGSIDFTLVDQVYACLRAHDPEIKILKTFAMVPTGQAKRPTEENPNYPSFPGGLSGPANLDAYENFIYQYILHTKNFLWAVEGWNEPYGCTEDHKEYTTMSLTELADVQKRLYRATKRVDPNMPVISPAQSYLCGIPLLLSAKTSEGEPIWKYFDVFAWHGYNEAANGAAGSDDYAKIVGNIRMELVRAGAPSDMPLADTEHGWGDWHPSGKIFQALSDDAKGKILYDTAELAKKLGVVTIAWYSYDDGLIGNPENKPTICEWLKEIYQTLNTPQ